MAKASLKSIAKIMKGLDLCMLTTVDGRGGSSSRPMSNNGDVEFDGTSYLYTLADTRMVREIKKNPKVSLQFLSSGLIKKNLFISVSGTAKLSTDREDLEAHWTPSLDYWFKDGIDTKGVVLVQVKANHIKYWSGQEEGEYKPSKR